jgi:hypothetical protein
MSHHPPSLTSAHPTATVHRPLASPSSNGRPLHAACVGSSTTIPTELPHPDHPRAKAYKDSTPSILSIPSSFSLSWSASSSWSFVSRCCSSPSPAHLTGYPPPYAGLGEPPCLGLAQGANTVTSRPPEPPLTSAAPPPNFPLRWALSPSPSHLIVCVVAHPSESPGHVGTTGAPFRPRCRPSLSCHLQITDELTFSTAIPLP